MAREVRALALRSLINVIQERYGALQFEGVLNHLSPEDREQVMDPASLVGSWVPFELIIRLLEAIAKAIFNGDESRLREIGRYSAQREFGRGIYRAFVKFGSPKAIIKAAPILGRIMWRPAVKCEAELVAPKKVFFRAHGLEVKQKAWEFFALGQIEELVWLSGGKNPRAEITRSLSDPGGVLELLGSWE